ncbi:MAG: Rep family protein [Bacteroides sp.]|nr:Rep family protein [Bacillota bacterium]MCM1393747.1 Rep family protein [[Eubacterium] siraeum]MCM1454952.1 Rep family protein [Bacteroides sp.]
MHLRQYEIVQDVDKLKVDIQQVCMQYKTIKQWAYIIHDMDDTRPHYHIYLYFGTGVDSKLVAEWFKLGYVSEDGKEYTGEQFISKVRGRRADVLMYLTHENESQKYKHVYPREKVISNFDFASEIEQSKIIGDFTAYSYAQQLQYVNTLPIDEKTKTYNKLKKLWELHCQTLALNSDRHIDVMFICGRGGAGKTFYAKKYLKGLGYDYCISSSSNDPFQDYMGQKAIILDDLRDTSFELEDLLKMLDNNTSSSVKSRFNNKVFNGEMIIITSSVPLSYWYLKYKSSLSFDNLDQLYRRITCYVEVGKDEIKVYSDGLDKYGRPTGEAYVFINELSTIEKKPKDRRNFAEEFGKICETKTVFYDAEPFA